mmetsp:Transcript_42050/g.125904  ORF Transcript_42050/g.125904 Transcript_42050/m.125904 type:complete len:85 (+) Transcript_42050:241-495(+)|eukprot:365125-Chlamydomonas_euryale.AAC.16
MPATNTQNAAGRYTSAPFLPPRGMARGKDRLAAAAAALRGRPGPAAPLAVAAAAQGAEAGAFAAAAMQPQGMGRAGPHLRRERL